MAVITKKIGHRAYAYISSREGKRVVHRYIGPVDDPRTQGRISVYADAGAVPEKFRSLFWDVRLEDIDMRRNSSYIISRVLDLGGLEALEWIQRSYPVKKILEVLVSGRALSERSRNFWSLWFGLKDS